MDISNAVWAESDAANSTAAPDGAPEGMAPGGTNNVLRAHQGAIKRFWRRNSVMFTAGTAAAYTVTHSVPPTALADGETDLVMFHAAPAAGATLNVGGLGAVPLRYYSAGTWRAVPADLWGPYQIFRVAFHVVTGAFLILDLPDRTGEIVAYAGPTAPVGTLLCYGQAISRTAYGGLFAALGTTHGVGDGASTFPLPDLRGRVGAGLGNMGGAESGRLNAYLSSVLGYAAGDQAAAYSFSGAISGGSAATNGMVTTTVSTGGALSTGGGGANTVTFDHNHLVSGNAVVTGTVSGTTTSGSNVQPTIELNFVIRI